VKVGIGVTAGRGLTVDEFVDNVHLAERLGYWFLGAGDSQSINVDTYVASTVLARESTRPLIGPMVTNPVTRHPAVTASAIASIDYVSGGRAVLGIGRGDNAPRNVGQPRASQVLLTDYVLALRELLAGRSVEWHGKNIHTRWITRPVPILLSASGPKTMRLAGQIADGVVMRGGALTGIVAANIELVREGAESVGRDPDEVQIWVMARGSARDTRAEAVGDVKASVSGAGPTVLMDEHVPEDLQPAFAELRSRYDYSQHVQVGGANADLVDALGLTDYLVDRYGIAGTAADCRQRVAALAEIGVDVLYFASGIRDPRTMIERLALEACGKFLPS
jgi:5,10-methylenetetrahydromethanopterin reductase